MQPEPTSFAPQSLFKHPALLLPPYSGDSFRRGVCDWVLGAAAAASSNLPLAWCMKPISMVLSELIAYDARSFVLY